LIDKKARRILFDAYWSADGWKVPRDEPSAADLAYARSAGVMFDPETLTHESAVDRILAAQSLADVASVADAFIASLASRQVHVRPALASYFAVRGVRPHRLVGHPSCASCGQFARWEHDFSATNFARLKWGAVPRHFMVDHAFILERFAVEPRLIPSETDRVLLRQLLTVADSLENGIRARDLERAWRPLLRSTREEREMLIEILFACGVLSPSRRTPADVRRIPWKADWSDEAALWRGDDGVDRARASMLFGHGVLGGPG
jgi:hypothetical protein